MITIPEFPLPSDIQTVIRFRVPNVEDSMAIADLNPDLEEAATTAFLNNQQDKEKQGGKVFDSALWTGEDRRTALWWIYISTHEDTTLPYRFTVNGEEHYVDLDLRDLGDTANTLSIAPVVPITFQAGDQEYKAKVRPLNGRALEEIELTRIARAGHDENSGRYRTLSNRIAMQELIYSLSIEGEPDDQKEAEEYRYKLVMGMALETDFRSLFAKVVEARRKLTHGLATSYKDGVYLMIANVELQEGRGKEPLMFPFQASNFLPAF